MIDKIVIPRSDEGLKQLWKSWVLMFVIIEE